MHEFDAFGSDGRDRKASVVFRDRVDAGRELAALLSALSAARPVVLGLPRGGVPVAAEVARELHAPLDVILVRKLGVPYQPELAAGAIGEGGVRVVNDEVRRSTAIDAGDLAAVEARERATLETMVRVFRRGRPAVSLLGRTVVVVDDGIATGSTARAACEVARAHGASRGVLAAPVIPAATLESLRGVADEIVCVESPAPFYAIGQWYDDFTQTTDREVVDLIDDAADRVNGADEHLSISLSGGRTLPGQLEIPPEAGGVVVFAHGSGSSRSSPRNRHVASTLRDFGLGTFLFDLLTPEEAEDRSMVFDIELLAQRLSLATTTVRSLRPSSPIGYFGASTGAAGALWAAAEAGSQVGAVVARGGRPDLAWARLPAVRAPTLLVVGELDAEVLELNRRALAALRCERELAVVAGATHLFDEPGTLDEVAALAARWFSSHLGAPLPRD